MWGRQCEVMTSDDVGLCGLKQIWFLFINIISYNIFTLTFGTLFDDSMMVSVYLSVEITWVMKELVFWPRLFRSTANLGKPY